MEGLEKLWRLLPADTRIPDHTIWDHLDLTSAFAGAMAQDPTGTPALLKMSFGPVQSFIEQARSTSDHWAGSHLLSRMVWEALRVICSELGPDAVLYPQLRGNPLVDAWLAEELDCEIEEINDELGRETDCNPLFSASLVNLFMAMVPASRAESLAERCNEAVRKWVEQKGMELSSLLLENVRPPESDENLEVLNAQIREQLKDFPEIFWSVVPWDLVRKGNPLDTANLENCLAAAGKGQENFLTSPAWQLLSKEIILDGVQFYLPNSGIVYPALYDLLDRFLAAAKSLKPFHQLKQHGYRCSLCGEREWMTLNRDHLEFTSEKRKKEGTLWTKLAASKLSWTRKGEHLCGLCSLKRLWPALFSKEIKKWSGGKINVDRFVISTHTMALPPSLRAALAGITGKDQPMCARLEKLRQMTADIQERVALPGKLYKDVCQAGDPWREVLPKLPLLLESLRDQAEAGNESSEKKLSSLEDEIKTVCGKKPENYYAFLLMDGDSMGEWISAGNEKSPRYGECWHPMLKSAMNVFAERYPEIKSYLDMHRPPMPAWQMAISGALNGFSLQVARVVVEELCDGKLLYAGGDDVMAMVSLTDLFRAMSWLRAAYSGISTEFPCAGTRIQSRKGHVLLKGKRTHLLRMMGEKATASMGIVIAHYSAPLGNVLHELRNAEKEAKELPGKDAFAIPADEAVWRDDDLQSSLVFARKKRPDGVAYSAPAVG